MRLRMKDIAQDLGVSVATISRAIDLEQCHKVAPHTLKLVKEYIAAKGYIPSLAAKNLRKTRTNSIGVVFPAFEGLFQNTYYTNMLAGIADSLLSTEFSFKLIMLNPAANRWSDVNFRLAEDVDGLLVTHWPEFFKNGRPIVTDIPCVFINDLAQGVNAYFVCGDHFGGGRLAGKHLYDLGHRDIGVLTGIDWSTDSALRLEGIRSFFSERGTHIHDSAVVCANYNEQQAYDITEEFLKQHPKISAIFCCNDEMAIGVIRKIQEIGLRCPEDISVVGYDDILRSQQNVPALTTVHDPVYELAKEGVSALMDYFRKGDFLHPFVGQKIIKTTLIARGSSGPFSVKP